jgi:hypothetical protein
MAATQTRKQFKEYCLRRLGWPVIDINVDDDQVEDRIDDALSFYYDYHFDGTEKMYMKHKITQADIDRRWIYCPDAVTFVTGVMPFDASASSVNMFDMRYQLRLHDLYDFTSVSYVSYEITMQHIQTLNMLFSGTPQFRFNRHQNKLMLDVDWLKNITLGQYVVIECYRKLQPDNKILTGTSNLVIGNTTVTGTNTIFDQEILEGDFVNFNGTNLQVKTINSPTEILLTSAPTANVSNVTMTLEGVADVWNDRFLKKYGTAKIKYQWGSNLSKFAGVQLPGGVTLDGPRIMQEALAEIDKLEEEMHSLNVLPSNMLMG